MKINLNEYLNDQHSKFFKCTDRIVLIYGSAGSGKSISCTDKIILQCLLNWKKSIKILIVRKTLPSCKKTCLTTFIERLELFGVPYRINRADSILNIFGATLYFLSINNAYEIEKIKSFTADLIWVEEVTELTELAIDQLNLRLRGNALGYNQLMMSFNPVSTTNFIYNKYFVQNEKATKFVYNIEKNRWANKRYIEILDNLEFTNKNLWRVYRKGEWGSLEGVIYTNYVIINTMPHNPDETIFGLDFGFNNPSALIQIDIKDKLLFLEERLYETHLTNSELVDRVKPIVQNNIVYCDSAEPARIKELQNAGVRAVASKKEVLEGIDFMQRHKLHILDTSINLIKEIQSYSWETDQDGRTLDKPVKFNEHLLSGMRYACYTHLKNRFKFIKIGAEGIIKDKPDDFSLVGKLNQMAQQNKINRMFRGKK